MNILRHFRNRIWVIAFDICMVAIAWFGAYWLRYDGIPDDMAVFKNSTHVYPVILITQSISYWVFGLYRGVWRFASMPDLMRLIKSVAFGTAISLIILFTVTRLQDIPRSIFPLYSMLLVLVLGGARFAFRYIKDATINFGKRVLIIGANQYGEALVRELRRERGKLGIPIVFIDSSVKQQGHEIQGVRVVAKLEELKEQVYKYSIDEIFIALPKASSKELRQVVDIANDTNLPVRVLPSVSDLVEDKVTLKSLREISIEDLLGRDEVTIDRDFIRTSIESKDILVTGAGGSIGSELSRQITRLKPNKIVLLDSCESNLFAIEQELIKNNINSVEIIASLNNVTDISGLKSVFKTHKPHIVFHAAAYKHVPMLQSQVRTAVINNIIGTKNVCELAIENEVDKFVLVSTDKAVNPVNIMGATKRIAEIICQKSNAVSRVNFLAVRFGNVLGSVGSVVPIFKQQLQNGGPLTVTHPDIERFFMSIPEASQLILQSMAMSNGGDTFVLDMGEPIKITYLAEQMIKLSGKEPGKDIQIKYTGLRDGEKLNEELFYKAEKLDKTSHNKIMKAMPFKLNWEMLSEYVNSLELAAYKNNTEVLEGLINNIINLECEQLYTAGDVEVVN